MRSIFQAGQRTPMDDWIFMASGQVGTALSGGLDWLAARKMAARDSV